MDKQDLEKCLTYKRESEFLPDFTTTKAHGIFCRIAITLSQVVGKLVCPNPTNITGRNE